jgi:hypothetical protein
MQLDVVPQKPQLRCSSLPLFFTCAPAVLNPDGLQAFETENEPATLGTAVHGLCETAVRTGTYDIRPFKQRFADEDYKRAGKLMQNFAHVWAEASKVMKEPLLEQEVIVDIGPMVLTGHIDVMYVDAAKKRAYIMDYKTGRQHENHFHQMAGYAYGVWVNRLNRHDEARVFVTAVYLEDTTVTPYEFSADDLVAWENELKIQTRNRAYVVGRKCFGCKLNTECPAYTKFVSSSIRLLAGKGHPETVADWKGLTPEARGQLMDRVYVLEKAIDRLKTSLRNAVRSAGALDVGNGKEYTIVEEKNEFLDPVLARRVLAKTLPLPLINRLSRISLVDALAAVVARAPKGVKAKAREAAYEKLDEAGAVIRNKSSKMFLRPIKEQKLR